MKKLGLLSTLILATPIFAQELILEELPPLPAAQEQPQETPAKQAALPLLPISANASVDELFSLTQTQTQAINELTNQLEQTQHKVKLLEEKLTRLSDDMSFRIKELEEKATATLAQPAAAPASTKSEQERYDEAYALLLKKDYANAEKQFLSLIADFPNSQLKPNMLYWLGETYYVQGQFEKAVGQFADVFSKHAKSNKAPDALLKMGLSMVSLKKTAEGCAAFLALPNEYPKAETALKERAKKEAEKYKCS